MVCVGRFMEVSASRSKIVKMESMSDKSTSLSMERLTHNSQNYKWTVNLIIKYTQKILAVESVDRLKSKNKITHTHPHVITMSNKNNTVVQIIK